MLFISIHTRDSVSKHITYRLPLFSTHFSQITSTFSYIDNKLHVCVANRFNTYIIFVKISNINICFSENHALF